MSLSLIGGNPVIHPSFIVLESLLKNTHPQKPSTPVTCDYKLIAPKTFVSPLSSQTDEKPGIAVTLGENKLSNIMTQLSSMNQVKGVENMHLYLATPVKLNQFQNVPEQNSSAAVMNSIVSCITKKIIEESKVPTPVSINPADYCVKTGNVTNKDNSSDGSPVLQLGKNLVQVGKNLADISSTPSSSTSKCPTVQCSTSYSKLSTNIIYLNAKLDTPSITNNGSKSGSAKDLSRYVTDSCDKVKLVPLNDSLSTSDSSLECESRSTESVLNKHHLHVKNKAYDNSQCSNTFQHYFDSETDSGNNQLQVNGISLKMNIVPSLQRKEVVGCNSNVSDPCASNSVKKYDTKNSYEMIDETNTETDVSHHIIPKL